MTEKRDRLMYGLFWIAFFNGIVATLISFHALQSTALPDSTFAWSYLVLQQIGHFQFFAWLLSLPLLIIAVVLPFRGLIRGLAFVVFSAFLLAVYADYVIYQLYRFHFNSMIWNLLFGGAVDEILVYDWQNLLTLGGAFFGALCLQWVIFSLVNAYQNLRIQKLGKWVFISVFSGSTKRPGNTCLGRCLAAARNYIAGALRAFCPALKDEAFFCVNMAGCRICHARQASKVRPKAISATL